MMGARQGERGGSRKKARARRKGKEGKEGREGEGRRGAKEETH